MYRHLLLGLTLIGATSCVPQDVALAPAHPPRTLAEARPLFRQLALDMPEAVERDVDSPIASSPRTLDTAPPFSVAAASIDDADRALECLTAAVYHEARSESADGQRAVAQVVLNRVRDRAFPRSVCGVVYQGSTRRTGCQFSFTCDGSLYRPREPGAWDRARSIARDALAGSVYAAVGAATFYHTSAVSPYWAPSLARIGSIGSHIFYRWPGAIERALAFRQRYAGQEPVIGGGASTPVAAATAVAAAILQEAGVTVHRGDAVVAAAAPTGRMVMASGVRIHRGRIAPDPTPDANGAVVGEESDPI